MTNLSRLAFSILAISLAVAVGAGSWWLLTHKPESTKTDKPTPPAKNSKPVKEDDLNILTLTPAAEERLGIKVSSLKKGLVEKKNLRPVRIYGGEVTIPIGQTILVAAPLGGMLKAPTQGMPRVGETVTKGQAILQLLPLLTPEGKTTMAAALVDAEGQVKNAQSQVDATKIAMDRANRLLREQAGSKRNVDETAAAYELATKTLEAAQARKTLMAQLLGEVDQGTAAPIAITSPGDGLLRNLSAQPGQNVPSGAGLFEIVDLSTVWVRVPIPVGDWQEIARDEPVQIGSLSVQSKEPTRLAKPVSAPPSANPLSASVDAMYSLPNDKGTFIPGQRLGVTIPLQHSEDVVVVPWSAVIFDIHGGTWIYEETGPLTFLRRRVVVRYVNGSDAVLSNGPKVGSSVVTEGSDELFGAEMGFSK